MSQEKTRTSVSQKLINKNLRGIRTTTIGKVLKVLANGWLEIDPQISMVQRDIDTGEETEIALPRMIRVPVGYYKAGGFIITLPTQIGDEGILTFSDRSLDLWKSTGKKAAPNSPRLHDISDAHFTPFPTSEPGAIQNFDTDHLVIGKEDGTAVLTIDRDTGDILLKSPTKITCEAPEVIVQSEIVDVTATTSLTANSPIMDFTASSSFTVTSPIVDFTASSSFEVTSAISTFNGAIVATSAVTGADLKLSGGGPSYSEHAHSGVQSGLSNSGGII